MDRWELLPRGVSWSARPLLCMSLSHDEMVRHFGPPCAVDLDSNGWGSYDAWAVRFACGLEVILAVFEIDGHGAPFGRSAPATVELTTDHPDLDHIRSHLPFAMGELSMWLPDRTIFPEKRWQVFRQDDNGNRIEIKRCSSQCEADFTAKEFEARGHKQLYWVEELSSESETGSLSP